MRGKHQSRATITQAIIDVLAIAALLVMTIAMFLLGVAIVGFAFWKLVLNP